MSWLPDYFVTAMFLGIVFWELLKYALRGLMGPRPKGQKPVDAESTIDEDDYPDLQIPAHPHIEFSVESEKGLQCSNPESPLLFDNHNCSGKFLVFHSPTQEGAQDHPYARYFVGKKRIWELRLQFRFKRLPAPGEDMFFGVELEKYVPLGAGAKHAMSMITAAIRNAVGGVYHSVGDDPTCMQGELEKPACVLPLWAFDQFIYTPAGQLPPSLTDPDFPNLGKKRSGRVKEYAKEIEELTKNFNAEGVYTLVSWGCSRFVDVINWELVGIPLVTPMDFDRFCGCPPVNIALYSLNDLNDEDLSPASRAPGSPPSPPKSVKEIRHLRSRKSYYFRISVWSSHRRPEKALFDSLTGNSTKDDTATLDSGSQGPYTLRRRIYSAFAVCYSRTEK